MSASGELGWRRRPVAGALGLRSPVSEHSEREGRLLERYAEGARCAVEIGVAEGASARILRSVLDPAGTLYLIDPYPPGRLLGINMARVIARRAVGRVDRGEAVWIRQRGEDAARGWSREIDFIFMDGDHTFEGVSGDWSAWSTHVREGGHIALHDAVVSEGSWVSPEDGPARLLATVIEPSRDWVVVDSADSTVVVRRAA